MQSMMDAMKNQKLKVDRTISDGEILPYCGGIQIIHTPGHTPGHVAFFRPSDKVLITGDAIVTVDLNSVWGFLLWCLRINYQRVSGPPWYSTWNWRVAKESVAVLARLEPHILAPGHGEPMADENTARELHVLHQDLSGHALVFMELKTISL